MTIGAAKPRLPALPLLMLVTESSPRRPEIIDAAIAGGVNLVQLRDRPDGDDFVRKALQKGVCSGTIVINGPESAPDRKNGLHLPEVADSGARRLREAFALPCVGRSAHSVDAAKFAAEDGADYVVVGTIYPSKSHPGLPGQGVDFLRQVCEAVAPLPVIAIGGITPERVGECIAAGASGIAVLSPIMRAADPRAVAQAYREELDKAWNLRSTENR